MVGGEGPARARNSNLNEDLGKVSYVFSDKTGTLTSNDMQLRMISIKDRSFGREQFRLVTSPALRINFCQVFLIDSID